MSDRRAVEVTAPCSVALGGAPGGATVAVAIDRRAWSRVEQTRAGGVEVFARDTVQKVSAASVAELEAGGRMPVVARVLRAMGVESGLTVETRSRLPEGSGLGESPALAVAVATAALEALGRPADPGTLGALLGADPGLEAGGLGAALHGGTVCAGRGPNGFRVRPLDVDPARVEESLLLVDSGSTRTPAPDEAEASGEWAGDVPEIGSALVAGRVEVLSLLAEEWEGRKRRCPAVSTPEIDRVASLVRDAGGAAWACGPGPGGLVAVWAPPGEHGAGRREAVEAAVSAAGLRLFPARVDLLGPDRA